MTNGNYLEKDTQETVPAGYLLEEELGGWRVGMGGRLLTGHPPHLLSCKSCECNSLFKKV